MGEKLSADFFDESPSKWSSLRDEPFAPSGDILEKLKISPEEYEQLGREEHRLRNGCFETGEGCGNVVAGGIYDICDLVEQKYKKSGKELAVTLNDTASASKNFNRRTTEALVDMIDAFYPSHFGNSNPSLSKRGAEEEYTIATNRNSVQLSMSISDVAKATSKIREFDDANIPSSVKKISDFAFNETDVSKKMIEYLENPTEDGRKELSRVLHGQTENITRQLRGLEEETSEINQNDFSESIYRMKTRYNSAKGDNINAVLGYIDFKIKHDSASNSASSMPEEPENKTPEESEYRKKLEDLFL